MFSIYVMSDDWKFPHILSDIYIYTYTHTHKPINVEYLDNAYD